MRNQIFCYKIVIFVLLVVADYESITGVQQGFIKQNQDLPLETTTVDMEISLTFL